MDDEYLDANGMITSAKVIEALVLIMSRHASHDVIQDEALRVILSALSKDSGTM
jgi:hypothetical protein